MRKKGIKIVADYIAHYTGELASLRFEPEKEFETLIEYEEGDGAALVSGAIDIVRQDDPPRVTLIDFKSGDPDSDNHQKLDEEEMRLQVAIYGVAAKKELEYKPEQGLVRYLDADDPQKRELQVPLDEIAIGEARTMVAKTAAQIRDRVFHLGPRTRDEGLPRCHECDFTGLCGMPQATAHKEANPRQW
jgi:DNA helicase-2/ATP-dependent DNA helicase PcrA